MKPTIAIAGATGAVGQQMLDCLQEYNIDANIRLLASARSKGKVINDLVVEELTPESFKGVDYTRHRLGVQHSPFRRHGYHNGGTCRKQRILD